MLWNEKYDHQSCCVTEHVHMQLYNEFVVVVVVVVVVA